MSYDLAVWEGDRPADDASALKQYLVLMDELDAGPSEPTPRIRGFVEALLARWSETGDGGDCQWYTSGTLAYVPLSYARAVEVAAHTAALAREHGLVCFDPQRELVL